jgi:hypothetical protein
MEVVMPSTPILHKNGIKKGEYHYGKRAKGGPAPFSRYQSIKITTVVSRDRVS